jgi:hypothetical protein
MNKKIVLIIVTLLYFIACGKNRDILIGDESQGVILKIYRERRNHNVYQFWIIENDKERFFVADFYPESWLYASIGDSIIKRKGEDFITIKKRDGSSMTFETRVK